MIDRGARSLVERVGKAYDQGYDDYHMTPLRSDGFVPVRDGDSVVFCCRRGEREIELTEMFTEEGFSAVPRRKLDDLEFVILTQYHEKFMHLPIAFAPEHVPEPLGEVLSKNGKTQFHCAESEKYAHVTFFFNGGENTPFPGEDDACVPSPKGVPFESVPELSLPQVVDRTEQALGNYDFIVVNFANGDVIGHTSDSKAKIKACQEVDTYLEKLVRAASKKNYIVAIVADHGNIEALRTSTGKPHVAHTTNKVAFLVMDGMEQKNSFSLSDGSLSNVAPTILEMMGIEKPECMDCKSLLEGASFGKDRKVLLLILDGWGIGSGDDNDAIHIADTPFWDQLLQKYTYSSLFAAGKYVGLGEGKPGNSEAGHINLGAGRCVAQDDIRIDRAMATGEFSKNSVIESAIVRARDKGSALHLITYLTYKSSHGSMEYAIETCRMASKLGMDRVYLHIIFDGRSTEPGSAPALLRELEEKIDAIGVGIIVDGVGRGVVLDRDGNYDKVKLAYDNMIGD